MIIVALEPIRMYPPASVLILSSSAHVRVYLCLHWWLGCVGVAEWRVSVAAFNKAHASATSSSMVAGDEADDGECLCVR